MTSVRRSSSSLFSTMPSSTIAAMPSSSTPVSPSSRVCANAWPAANTVHHAAANDRNLRIEVISVTACAGASVTQDTTVEKLLRGGHPLAEALELELDRDRAVRFPRPSAHVTPADAAQPPAARFVLPAEVLLQRLLLEERIA